MQTATRVRRDQLRRIVAHWPKGDQRELVRCMQAFRAAADELGEGEWALAWWW